MPTPVPSQMPSYCYDYGYEYPFPDIYYPTSGPGCELSLGAGVSIAAIILWFISGIVLLFRKPRNRPIVKCCKPCAPCCDEATSYPGTYSSNISGATNTENADIRMVVNEVANLDGSKRAVTSFEPGYKEKKTVVELIHLDGSSTVKTFHETIVHNKV